MLNLKNILKLKSATKVGTQGVYKYTLYNYYIYNVCIKNGIIIRLAHYTEPTLFIKNKYKPNKYEANKILNLIYKFNY